MEKNSQTFKMLQPRIMIRNAGFTAAYVVISLLIIGVTQNAHALRTELGGGIGAEFSDNIQRVATDQQKELVRIGVVGVSLEEDSESIIADVAASLRYEDFYNHSSDDQFLFALTSKAEWRISPDRLSWTISDDFRQLPVDSVDPRTPDNRQNSNAFSTGPDAFLRFGPVNRLELGARFEDTRFEVSTSDSKRYSAFAKWRYTPISTRELSLNIKAEKVNFEAASSSNSDFNRQDYSLDFLTRTGRSELRYEIGGTSIQRADGDFNGPLMGLYWKWTPTRLSIFNFSATSELTDSGRDLLTATSSTDQELLQTTQIAPDLFRERKLELEYTREGDRLGGRLNTFWIDRDYKTAPLDEEVSGLLGDISYNVAPPLLVSVGGGIQVTKVFASRTQNDDYLIGTTLGYLFRRDLTVQLSVAYFERKSNQPDAGYDEFRVLLGAIYNLGAIPGGGIGSAR